MSRFTVLFTKSSCSSLPFSDTTLTCTKKSPKSLSSKGIYYLISSRLFCTYPLFTVLSLHYFISWDTLHLLPIVNRRRVCDQIIKKKTSYKFFSRVFFYICSVSCRSINLLFSLSFSPFPLNTPTFILPPSFYPTLINTVYPHSRFFCSVFSLSLLQTLFVSPFISLFESSNPTYTRNWDYKYLYCLSRLS